MTEDKHVASESDARTINNSSNAMRTNYRVLSDEEKAAMVAVKAKGQEFLDLIDTLRSQPVPMGATNDGEPIVAQSFDRELSIAVERAEEAVMWVVKHITR